MCYSAQIDADYRKYLRATGDAIGLRGFYELFWRRQGDSSIKIPKAVEALFSDDDQIAPLIGAFNVTQATVLEQELFRQRKRLADAERTLQTKTTKAITESRRIAASKVEWAKGKLADLRRTELEDRDARIFPGWYAPLLVVENGQRFIKPMRYQCRPAGKPASYDRQFPGTYNARRDNLEGFWRGQFGHTHGIMLASTFYENVVRPSGNVVLEFRPRPAQTMLVACLWSRWSAPGEPDLFSFAAITDEPPPEVAAAGHDRCIIPIRPENLRAWLSPNASDRAAQYAILDARERPYYEHAMAA